MQPFTRHSTTFARFSVLRHLFLQYLRLMSIVGTSWDSTSDKSLCICINESFPLVVDLISRCQEFSIYSLHVALYNVGSLPTNQRVGVVLEKRPFCSTSVDSFDLYVSVLNSASLPPLPPTYADWDLSMSDLERPCFLTPQFVQHAFELWSLSSGQCEVCFLHTLRLPSCRFTFLNSGFPFATPSCLFAERSPSNLFPEHLTASPAVLEVSPTACPLFYARLTFSRFLWGSLGFFFETVFFRFQVLFLTKSSHFMDLPTDTTGIIKAFYLLSVMEDVLVDVPLQCFLTICY